MYTFFYCPHSTAWLKGHQIIKPHCWFLPWAVWYKVDHSVGVCVWGGVCVRMECVVPCKDLGEVVQGNTYFKVSCLVSPFVYFICCFLQLHRNYMLWAALFLEVPSYLLLLSGCHFSSSTIFFNFSSISESTPRHTPLRKSLLCSLFLHTYFS